MAKRRKNGTGSVHLRKDGRWEGRMVIGYDENGWPKTKNVLAKTRTECTRKLKALQEGSEEKKPETVRAMTFGDWLDYWYQNHSKPRIRKATQQNYENWIYHHAIPGLGEIPLQELSQGQLQSFFAEMKRSGRKILTDRCGTEMSAKSVRSCYAVCKMALDRAVQDGLIRKNPAIGCKLPPSKEQEMKILSEDELQRFLMQANEEGLYELFLLECTSGMRRGELLALQWGDLDFNTGELHIDRQVYPVHGKLIIGEPKTKAGKRSIVLPMDMVDLLREYRKGVFSQWMFPSRTKPEQPIDPDHIRKRLHRILEQSGCKDVRFHDLRHTFATMSLEHGMDIKTLSAVIGHASAATTLNTYTHVTSEMQAQAALRIDKGIAGVESFETVSVPCEASVAKAPYQPVKLKRRRPGTGCVSRINDHLWEGRYSPKWIDGKKRARNVYAKTEAECEEKLAALILDMKAGLARLRKEQGAQKLHR